MNRSVKRRYINWLLFVLNILCILYTFLKCILCPNEISEVFKTLGIKCLGIVLSWYKFGVNELKATEGVTIFVY